LAQFAALDAGNYPRLPADVPDREICQDWRMNEPPPPCDKQSICPYTMDLVITAVYLDEDSGQYQSCQAVAGYALVVDLPAVAGIACEQLQGFFATTACCTPRPTSEPTNLPTFAPTSRPTSPKPAFIAADFAAVLTATPVADSIVGTITLAPTPMPTSMPTTAGYQVVEKQENVKVLTTAISFPLTAVQAQDPVMKTSLEGGVASALGLSPSMVAVTHIDGQPVSRRLADAVISFEVQSPSSTSTAVADLRADMQTAATEGSLVANVQEHAMQNGVLVAALQSMDRDLGTLSVAESTKTVSVMTQEHTAMPTASPITANSYSDDGNDGGADVAVIAGAVVAVVAVIVIAVCARSCCCKKASQAPPTATPVPVKKLEQGLSVAAEPHVQV